MRIGGTLNTGTGQSNCSAFQQLLIGTCIYGSCNGQGRELYSFPTLVSNGGTENVIASFNNPVCLSNTNLLNATAKGVIDGSITFNRSSPASFVSILEDPTRLNANLEMSGNYQVLFKNIAGRCNKTCTQTNVAKGPVDVTPLNKWTGAIDSF